MLLILITAAFLIEAGRLAWFGYEAQTGASGAQRVTSSLGSPADWNAPAIESAAAASGDSVRRLRAGSRGLVDDPLLALATRLPRVGIQAQAIRDLAAASVAASDSVPDLVDLARSYDALRQSHDSAGTKFLSFIVTARAPATRAAGRMDAPVQALREDSRHRLAGPIARRVQAAAGGLGPVDDQVALVANAGRLFPEALGAGGRKRYLLLLPNPSEIRPDGGFSGVVGTVTFDSGTPTVELISQDRLNSQYKQPFPIPYPMDRFLIFFHNALEIGDAGWDPDFPSSARLSEQMWSSATGQPVDGTVSLDPYVVAALLGVAGPLDVPGYGTFTSADFFARLNALVNTGSGPGKDAVSSAVSAAALRHILGSPPTAWPKMLTLLQQQAHSRHLQFYLHDRDLQQRAAAAGYDGGVRQTGFGEDYLMLVDANIGATKGDAYVRKSTEVRAEVHETGIVRHQVTVRYEMPPVTDSIDRELNPGDGAYRDYLRFYIPVGASVRQMSFTLDGRPSPAGGGVDRVSQASGKQVVATYFGVPRGHVGQVSLFYDSPATANDYRLTIQKQAGIPSLATRIIATYPGGRYEATPDLSEDLSLRLRW